MITTTRRISTAAVARRQVGELRYYGSHEALFSKVKVFKLRNHDGNTRVGPKTCQDRTGLLG